MRAKATKMGCGSRLLLFFGLAFLQLLVLNMAQLDPLAFSCGSTGNFTINGTYGSNLNRLLASLSSNTTIDYGFYSDSLGQNADKVNAIALCRGDKNPDTCRSCIFNSSQVLKKHCPNQKEAITWYDDCMLRYSNRSIFGKVEFSPSGSLVNINNVSNINEFNQVLNTLLDGLTSRAASGDSLRKFATGSSATMENNQTIYALVQCTPDLSKQDCSNCLNNVTAMIPQYFSGKKGARTITPSCQFRYETELFYDSAPDMLSPTPSPSPSPSSQTEIAPQPPTGTTSITSPPPPNDAARITGRESNIAVAFILSVLVALL